MSGLTIPFFGLRKQYHNLRTEILAVTDEVLRSGHLVSGNYTAEFENWLARKNNVKYAVTCHSGTQALEIIAAYYVHQYSFYSNPRAVIPSFTFPATLHAFLRTGWRPMLVDCDRSGVLRLGTVQANEDALVIVVVGLYGASVANLVDSTVLKSVLLQNVVIIEDAAQHWLASQCQRIGPAAISFDPTKNLNANGNGGAVVTDDPNLAEFARDWRQNRPYKSWVHQTASTNSRMSELDCAGLLIKSRYIDQWQTRRRAIAEHWIRELANTPVRCFVTANNIRDHALQKFVIECDNRDALRKQLSQRMIETRVHYESPLHEQHEYAVDHAMDAFSNASVMARRVLSLPIYPELTDLEVEYIVEQVKLSVENQSTV
jgi:dTDP-4-amino-4,6-dideoxygalactose transaminase